MTSSRPIRPSVRPALGFRLRSLTEAIGTETPKGSAMWQMIGVFAELERSLIVERTRATVYRALQAEE